MRLELNDLSDPIIQPYVNQVADFDFASKLASAAHVVFLFGCFPNAPG